MAYTLQTSGLATDLVYCVMVDEDGTTVREFVSPTVNSTMTLTNVTVGTGSWKGEARNYFTCSANGSFNYYGPKFVTNQPTLPGSATGFCVLDICHAMGTATGTRTLVEGTSGASVVATNASNRLLASRGGSALGTTALPTGTTKFSAAHNHKAFVSNDFFYGLESGSGAADGTSADGGFGASSTVVSGLGGAAGQGASPGSYYARLGFGRTLTEAEYQSVHDDFFGVLFDSGAAMPVVTCTGSALAYTEADGPVAIDSGITVTDADSSDLTGATVEITANYQSAEDVLAFTNQLGITGSWNSGTGVLTLSGTTTVANYQTALRSITYENVSLTPATSARTVTFTATAADGDGSDTRSITVAAVTPPDITTETLVSVKISNGLSLTPSGYPIIRAKGV